MNLRQTLSKLSKIKNCTISDKLNYIKLNTDLNDIEKCLTYLRLDKLKFDKKIFKSHEEIDLNKLFSFSESFEREIIWSLIDIKNHKDIILDFLEIKENFEKNILLEKYDNSIQLLEKFENTNGHTLWSLESRLLLAEKLNGTKANWELLSQFIKTIKSPYYNFFLSSASKRNEKNITFEGVLNQFQYDLDHTNAPAYVKDLLVFRSFYLVNYDFEFEDLSSVVYLSGLFNITDQYLIIRNVIIKNLENYGDVRLKKIFNKLTDFKTGDRIIGNIINYCEKTLKHRNIDNTEYNFILDNYNIGNYEYVLENSERLIKKYPNEYIIYELYCKSLVIKGQKFQSLNLSKNIDSILQNTYDTVAFNKELGYNNLLKESLTLNTFNIGNEIFHLISKLDGKDSGSIFGILNQSYQSYELLKNVKYNDLTLDTNLNSIYLENSYYKYGKLDSTSFSYSNNETKMFYSLLNHFSRKEYFKIIDTFINNFENNYFEEYRLYILYTSYFCLDDIQNSLKYALKIHFSKEISSRKLDYNILYDKLNSLDNKDELYINPEFLILMSLFKKEFDLYEDLDEFMNFNELYIDEFIGENTFDIFKEKEHLIHFYYKILEIDVIKYNVYFSSISMVEEYRINILKFLISFDTENKISYERDIDELYKTGAVRNVVNELNEGRIFIDVNNIRRFQVKKFNDEYNRFKEIQAISSSSKLAGFNSAYSNWDLLNTKNSYNKGFSSADYLAFKNLYLECRENFLFSKEYGLDSCLSTRIRHGSLKNHIRSVFENLKIINSTLNENYINNKYWESNFRNSGAAENIQKILKTYSKKIDTLNKEIVDNLIQIKTEKTSENNHDGLFIYYLIDEQLFRIYNDLAETNVLDTVDSTIGFILDDLVNYTEFFILPRIEKTFNDSVFVSFIEVIEEAISEIRLLSIENDFGLLYSFNKAKTDLHREIQTIIKWFKISTTSPSNLLGLDTIINASIALTNKINPLSKLNPEITIKDDYVIKGNSSLIFVFNILLTNVILHSKLDIDHLNLKINVDYDDLYFIVSFCHDLDINVDYSDNLRKLENIQNNWNNHSDIERSNKEGESGYDKIKRILIYEALAKSDKFTYEMREHKLSISLYLPKKII